MMTMTEMQQRAQERAAGMGTLQLADGRTYLVRSRSTDGFYTVQTSAGHIGSTVTAQAGSTATSASTRRPCGQADTHGEAGSLA